MVPGDTESQEDESPDVTENIGLKLVAAEVLLVLLELVETVELVEVADVVTEGFTGAVVDILVPLLEEETALEETMLGVALADGEEMALPERVPEMTLEPELEGEPREVLSQHVP